MGIPLYGQNKDGSSVNHWVDGLKLLEFDIAVSTSGNGNNADTGFDMPANFMPLYSIAKNSGDTALAANTCALDVGGTDIIADVDALAADSSVYLGLGSFGVLSSATNILIDGGSGLVVGSDSTVLNVKVVGLDLTAVSLSQLATIKHA
jgi:hypothetical protein